MKEKKIERISYEIQYEAKDGTVFTNKVECEQYEKSAFAAINSQYKTLIINEVSEQSLFEFGRDDNTLEIVSLNCSNDIDLVLKMLFIVEPYKKDREEIVNEYIKKLREALESNEPVIIYRGYDKDCFHIEGTLNYIFEEIKERYKKYYVGNKPCKSI